MRNNDIVHISDGDNWEILYINGKKMIEGHQVYVSQLLEEIAKLEGTFTCYSYVLNEPYDEDTAGEESQAWQEVFGNSPKDLIHILHWLKSDKFEEG